MPAERAAVTERALLHLLHSVVHMDSDLDSTRDSLNGLRLGLGLVRVFFPDSLCLSTHIPIL